MKVSLNIILESLRDYRLESRIDESAGHSFRQARLLTSDETDFDPDFLYVGMLSEAINAAKKTRESIFLCIHDRVMTEREREHFLPSVVIIREDLSPAQLLSIVQKNILTIQEWHDAMQETVINQKKLQDILDLSEPVIGNFISINDSAFALRAYTKGIPTDDEASIYLIENGHHSPETMKRFKQLKRFEVWFSAGDDFVISTDRGVSNCIIINRIFVHDETNFTNVVMHCNRKPLTPGLLDLYKELAKFLGIYIERDLKERRYSIYSSLIDDLMTGKISDADIVAEHAKSVGLMPNANTAVLLLEEQEGGPVIFSERLTRDITRMFLHIKSGNYNQRLMLLANHPDLHYYMGRQGIGEKLNAFLADNNIYCGVSEIITDLRELRTAYAQAEFALNNRKNMSSFNKKIGNPQRRWSNIIYFSEHYAEFLLRDGRKDDSIWRTSEYGKMLLRLQKTDIEKHTNNLEILYLFLVNERRATDAAAALYMHRNNVNYRIGRIEEMLDIRLDDPMTRINLLVTYLLFDMGDLQQTEESGTAAEVKAI